MTASPSDEMGSIHFEADGTVTIITGTLDYGQGHATPFAQVLADRLGVPFERIDVLVVDRVGKNISGGGGDPNVTGRFPSRHITGAPAVGRLVYLSLTPEAEGNGNGVGLADVVTADLASAYSPSATYLNALTTTAAENSRLPMVMPTPALAVAAALKMVAGRAPEDASLVRILDTLHVKRFQATRAALRDLEARGSQEFTLLGPFEPLRFGGVENPEKFWNFA